MTTQMNRLTILYPDDLLLSLKESAEEFEQEARLLLAVKLYEMNRITTGMAAKIAGQERVEFMFALKKFGLSPIGIEPDELETDFQLLLESDIGVVIVEDNKLVEAQRIITQLKGETV